MPSLQTGFEEYNYSCDLTAEKAYEKYGDKVLMKIQNIIPYNRKKIFLRKKKKMDQNAKKVHLRHPWLGDLKMPLKSQLLTTNMRLRPFGLHPYWTLSQLLLNVVKICGQNNGAKDCANRRCRPSNIAYSRSLSAMFLLRIRCPDLRPTGEEIIFMFL